MTTNPNAESAANQAKKATDTAANQAKKATDNAANASKNAANTAKQGADKMSDETTRAFEENTKRFEENTERVKEFNASLFESSKAGGRVVVDNYETAAKTFFDMQRQFAEASQVDSVKDTAKTQIQFAEEVTEAWVKAARKLMK